MIGFSITRNLVNTWWLLSALSAERHVLESEPLLAIANAVAVMKTKISFMTDRKLIPNFNKVL